MAKRMAISLQFGWGPSTPAIELSVARADAAAAFYAEVGQAVSHWARIEQTLSTLFVRFVTPHSVESGLDMYWGSNQFSAQLRMAIAGIEPVLKYQVPELFDEWSKLHRKIDKMAQKRNAIAHGVVYSWTGTLPGWQGPPLGLCPSHKNLFLNNEKSNGPTYFQSNVMSFSQLEAVRSGIEQLADDLDAFSMRRPST